MSSASIGCWFESGIAHFRVYAPEAQTIHLHFPMMDEKHEMVRDHSGYWFMTSPAFRPGELYDFIVDGEGPFPDPASRYQPRGVHGPSMGMDLQNYLWKNANPSLPIPTARSIYELHIGTFTAEGTFLGAAKRLPMLCGLGVTCIELMPVADFPGERGWGYDGVSMYAPARCYGNPDDLCHLIDTAHGLGLCVLLDVVYNHFGPDGNYTGVYSRFYLNPRHQTPWGDALNFDGEHSDAIRAFFLENALQWLRDYRFDGLRLDATHAICDSSSLHFLAELRDAVRLAIPEREVLIYAEDHRNPNYFCLPKELGGFELDGVWADDLHHHLRRKVTGDCEGYYAPFDGTMPHICKTLLRGWFRDGSARRGFLSEGSDPTVLDYSKFLICIQNHDQIGNRAMGERIHHQIPLELYRALSTLLLMAPETPLLFMGQEWACKTPFQFFTHHNPELGALVTEGRRKEFQSFRAFADPQARLLIPDPQAVSTFTNSRLDWSEIAMPPHRGIWNLYQALLRLRATHPALQSERRADFEIHSFGEYGLLLLRKNNSYRLACAICLEQGKGPLTIPIPDSGCSPWRKILTTEDDSNESFILQSRDSKGLLQIQFRRAGAWLAESAIL